MPGLRGILIVFAVLLLAAIYWWGRRSSRQQRSGETLQLPEVTGNPLEPVALLEQSAERLQPKISPLTAEPDDSEPFITELEAPRMSSEPLASLSETEPEEPTALRDVDSDPTHKIIALRLVATMPRFSGAHLRTALEAEALQFGKYQIFHRITEQGAVVFSVAGMLEPGSFDLEQMFHEQYPGIALFAQLPGELDGITVLRDLISCARNLQQTLGGVLQDDLGAPLLAARIEQLRREVRDFEASCQRRRSESSHP
jgi:cell division protein ZipA